MPNFEKNTWDEYLNKNYRSSGTQTNMSKISNKINYPFSTNDSELKETFESINKTPVKEDIYNTKFSKTNIEISNKVQQNKIETFNQSVYKYFDDTIVNKNNKPGFAKIKTLENGETEIRINLNSNRSAEFLLTHEITHTIETNSMKELVLDYAKKYKDFNKSLESLKQSYGIDDISSEVLADISGQLFGNQKFINSLSTEKPSVFKKIYNKIVDLANKLIDNTNENLFIQDLKNK